MALKTSTQHGDFRIFRVREDIRTSPLTGNDHPFSILESDDWVNVLPITSDGQAVLIRQWRHGRGEITWEIPGGLIDPGEDPCTAARRELREETGFAAGRVEYAGAITPNPAFLTNQCHICIAFDCENMGETNLDVGEDITTHIVQIEELIEMVKNGDIDHAMVVSAILLCDLKMRLPGR